jgi:hypothetical protein
MALATCCLGESRRDWAFAMQAEFDEAGGERAQLAFAAGCLVAAARELPHHAEGRLTLADHALALGLLVPMASLQFACAIGLMGGQGGIYGMLAMEGGHDPFIANAQFGAVPVLLVLWLLLGLCHLRLAWLLLDRDWAGVVQAGALTASGALTLVMLVAVLQLQAAFLAPVVGMLAVEAIFVTAVAQWDGRALREGVPVSARW